MRAESKKTVAIITLTVSAILIVVLPLLDFISQKDGGFWFFRWLCNEVNFFLWGWLLACCIVGLTLVGTIRWKRNNPLLW